MRSDVEKSTNCKSLWHITRDLLLRSEMFGTFRDIGRTEFTILTVSRCGIEEPLPGILSVTRDVLVTLLPQWVMIK
jgi:hypothetical protein